jgi:hypothetical protein
MSRLSALAAALLVLVTGTRTAGAFSGKVVDVSKGDTITVLRDTKPLTVYRDDVDGPEMDQPFGPAAGDPVPPWAWRRERESRCAYLSMRIEGVSGCTVALGRKDIVRPPILKYCLAPGRWRIVVKCPGGRIDRTLRLTAGEHLKWIVRATDLGASRGPSR